jgi:hypothetical protein
MGRAAGLRAADEACVDRIGLGELPAASANRRTFSGATTTTGSPFEQMDVELVLADIDANIYPGMMFGHGYSVLLNSGS